MFLAIGASRAVPSWQMKPPPTNGLKPSVRPNDPVCAHHTVIHSDEEYDTKRAHRPTPTSLKAFCVFTRSMRGTYQHCAEKHLHRYLAEFDFRYNNRQKLGMNDAARAEHAVKGIVGKRLTYQTIS
jgi:hypothetical protein